MDRLRVLGLSLLLGCNTHRAISGQVVDRNGNPMDRVIISVAPGGVEMVTDSEGYFVIDYLRNDTGERIKLDKRQEYEVEAFRAGYHINSNLFFYKKGELYLDPITLTEDTIRVPFSEENIDPAQFPERTNATGVNYEGE